MTIDLESAIPRYVQLAQWLEARMASGELRPGDRVYSERELSRMSGLTTMTVRQSLAELVRKGRLVREHGRGTFVTKPPAAPAVRARVAILFSDMQGEIAEGYQFIVSEQLAGLQSVFESDGGELTVLNIAGSRRRQMERSLLAEDGARFDGLIITGAMHALRPLFEKVIAAGIPHVALSDPFRPDAPAPAGGNFIFPDAREAGVIAAAAFVARGHRRIAYAGGKVERLDGFRRRLAEHGLEQPQEFTVIDKAISFLECERAGFQAASALLRRASPPSAIFAGNDYRAFGVLRALSELKLRTPADVAVIGCDDIRDGHAASLASIHLPHARAAQQAARELLDWIAHPSTYKPGQKPVAPKLIVRDSLGSSTK